MKRTLSALLSFLLAISAAGCGSADTEDIAQTTTNTPTFTQYNVSCTFPINTEEDVPLYQKYAEMSPEEITASLTLEQKAAQMVQPAVYMLSESDMKANCYGSILSKSSSVTYTEWQSIVDGYQQSAVLSDAGIPYLYGQDDVHGVNYCDGAVIFPHNIGIGAANDPELTYQMGLATADEAKLCHMLWNFAPCVAQSEDPRWGRTYESYGSDLEIIKSLGTAYTRGLVDGGVIACAKHFFGDGNVEYGTGENSDAYRLIDRGNAELSEEEISALLDVYRAEIEAGVQTIMISHSAVNGLKMHENAQYIQYLKNELGFEGFIVSDWNSVQNTSPSTYKEQVITAVNAGIDMLMEVDRFDEAMQIIIEAVQSGDIPEERVNDAVCRIIRVKLDEGIFDDPFCENMETVQSETGSEEYRALAEQLVEKSLVLLKNEGDVLPIKEGASVYITGPAADSPRAQCGGWTIDWNQSPSEEINGVTTILEGFKQKAAEYGITIITDKDQAENADIVLLVVGEQAYAEWLGDTEDMELCGAFGLSGNSAAIEEAKALEKPTVACIVAGRQVIIDDYADDWDAVVMCYLPGSEGQGIADVLCGGSDFTGRLPSPWYSSTDRIGTEDCWLEKGFGISY
ncbi:MAG: glycoside hydrolase family 3 protein [Oscillospiraceae bacterium]|nr:glycoside hydrolase family 3 protein [Oscillospiraceae bacterium]